MLIRLGPTDDGPLHEQIAAAVRRAVVEGEVEVGDRLPGARDLADQLDVNVNTVLRAYRALRDDGLIELRRGRGATVIREADDAALHTLVDRLLTEAERLGTPLPALLDLLQERAR